MNDLSIKYNGYVDRPIINAALSDSSSYLIDIEGNGESLFFDISELGTVEQEAIKKMVDLTSFKLYEGAWIWKVVRDGKDFDLTSSYVRDTESTSGTLMAIADGSAIIARFEVPGFSGNEVRNITVWMNDDFDPAELTELAEIGISITGDGGAFTIDNATPCLVSFSKPSAVTENYVIVDPQAADIIAV